MCIYSTKEATLL